MSTHRIATLVAVLGLTAAAAAQTSSPMVPARRSALEVTPAGAFLREARGHAAPGQPGSPELTNPGLLWSKGDGGLAWIGTAVSIGDRGTQVLAEYDLNNEAAELFSVFDSSPPTAVWTDGTPLGTENRMVASADATNTHVAIHQVVLGGNQQTRQAVLRKYSSSSGTPDWSYTFAPVINARSKVGISRDGQTIVGVLMNDNTFDVEIAVFGPASSTPVSYTAVPVGANNTLRGFDLSADGSTLYFSAGVTAHVFDIATKTVVFTTNIGASFDSHAISGDGSVFAFGNFNVMRVWEKAGAIYTNTHTETKPGQVYCARIDISDDSSTVAAGWYYYSPGLQVTIEALDVPSKTTTMGETLLGVGTVQNVVADVSCSADGSRFAVGLWGDAGTVDEVRLYARDQNTPVVSFDTHGSVFDIDLSADGQRVVAGSKAVHANTFGSGGNLDLVDAGGEDLVLRGRPAIGQQVQYEVHGQPGKNAFLLTSLAEANNPFTYPGGIGTLYIDRSTLTIQFMQQVQPNGVALLSQVIANDPALVGKSFYFQALTVAPRRLTQDWFKTTILP